MGKIVVVERADDSISRVLIGNPAIDKATRFGIDLLPGHPHYPDSGFALSAESPSAAELAVGVGGRRWLGLSRANCLIGGSSKYALACLNHCRCRSKPAKKTLHARHKRPRTSLVS